MTATHASSSKGNGPLLLLGLAGAGAVAWIMTHGKTASAAPAPTAAAKKPASKPTSELSEYLKQQMALALGMLGVDPTTGKLNGAANAEAIQFATSVVGQLKAEGFPDAAAALQVYIDQAAKAVPTPASAAPIAASLPAGLTQDQKDYIARAMVLSRDPDQIGLLISWLKTLAPSPERDSSIQMAQALALQLASAQSTSTTLQKIDAVIKAPDAAGVQQAASAPQSALPPIPISPPAAAAPPKPPPIVIPPAPPGTTVPSFVPVQAAAPPASPLPSAPVSVPTTPIPQAVPAAATPEELAAKAMILNLGLTQAKYGIKPAKGKEDKSLVKKFQQLVGAAQDGLAGPATFILAAAKGAVALPFVYYWPSTATAATVAQYRDSLSKVADKLDSVGRSAEAATLRVSLSRETGQSGINGPAFGASTPAPPVTPAPVAAPKPVATPVMVSDPAPGNPTLKKGDKGTMVTSWQTRLNKKGTNWPGANIKADGDFGPASDTATKNFQTSQGLTADGIVGPNTRIAAVKAGIW